MKILIMRYSNSSWYKSKIGKTYNVQVVRNGNYVTKDGVVNKNHAEVIEK